MTAAPASRDITTAYRRLHPSSLIFHAISQGRRLLLPGLIVLVLATASDESRWELWLMAFFIPAILYEMLRYFTLRYRFADDDLIVRQGLLFRSERHVPYKKIQNIDMTQNWLMRLVNVAEVKLQTGSGREAEAELKVLSLESIEDMRRRVFAGRRAHQPTDEAEDAETDETILHNQVDSPSRGSVLHHLPVSELVKLGCIVNRGLLLIPIVMGLLWELNLFDRVFSEETFGEVQHFFEGAGSVIIAIGLGFIALLILWACSICWSILRFYNYRLERIGDDLRISCGLLTRHAATVPRHRIQVISIHESILHRPFKRVAIRIETAGGVEENDDSISRKWFVPIIPYDRVDALLTELNPHFHLGAVGWRHLPPRAKYRMMRFSGILALIISAALCALFFPWGGLAIVVLVPLQLWIAAREANYTAYAPLEWGLVFRSGVLTRKISAALYEKIQTVLVRESPFDRRWKMVSVEVDTAGAGPAGHRIHVPHLIAHVGRDVADSIADSIEQTSFRW